jgi:hypothetical protein
VQHCPVKSAIQTDLRPERPHRPVQLAAQAQQLLALLTPFTNALQVVLTQRVNPLAVVANLAHRAALLRGHIGNPHGRVGNGADGADDLVQRAIGRLGWLAVASACSSCGAHAVHRVAGGLLQAVDQGLDFAGGAGGALGQRAHFVGDHGKATAHFTGAGGFDGGVQGQQVGLFGNRADHRQHAADGGRLLGQLFDHAALPCTSSTSARSPDRLWPITAWPVPPHAGRRGWPRRRRWHRRPLAEWSPPVRPGHRGSAVSPAWRSAPSCSAAHAGQGVAAAGHLLGVVADGAHQLHQVLAQAVERLLDVVQFAVGLAQGDGLGEVAFGPARQGRRQAGQGACQAPLQGVDQQGDQQDQADHQALDDAHFAGDFAVLGAHHGLQRGDGLLHGVKALAGAGGQGGAPLDLFAGALQLGRVAVEQALQFALEADGDVFLLGAGLASRPIMAAKSSAPIRRAGYAEQWQAVERLGLGADSCRLALDIVGQFRAAAADQLVAGQGQLAPGAGWRRAAAASSGWPRRCRCGVLASCSRFAPSSRSACSNRACGSASLPAASSSFC